LSYDIWICLRKYCIIYSSVDVQTIIQLSITCKRFRSVFDSYLLAEIFDINNFISRQNKIKNSPYWYNLIKPIALKNGFVEIDDEPRFILEQNYKYYHSYIYSRISRYEFPKFQFQTRKICLRAVMSDGFNLKHIHHQTPEICFAVRNKGTALEYVREQTPEICLVAVRNDSNALKHVHEQTPKICSAAIEQNSKASKYVRKPLNKTSSS